MKKQPVHDNKLSPIYKELLVASGLVDGIEQIELLKPFYRELMENEVLCRPGDPTDCLWIVAKGILAVKENDLTLVTRNRGSLLGEQGLLDQRGGRRLELVAVNGPVEILEISLPAIEAHPNASQIWRNCAWILCMKLDETTADIVEARRKLILYQNYLRLFVGEYALSVEKLAPEAVLQRPRRETVIIWFSDIIGFSKYSSTMPPQNASAFVQRFLTPQVKAIDSRKGFIDKFIGDAVMAYWIVKTKTGKDECESAFSAAMEVVDKIKEIKIGDSSLSIRIGLHIGDVSIGNFGTQMRSQFTLIGSEVNKAARLERAINDDVKSGDFIGAIRISDIFYDVISERTKKLISRVSIVEAKNIGPLKIHSTNNEI